MYFEIKDIDNIINSYKKSFEKYDNMFLKCKKQFINYDKYFILWWGKSSLKYLV